MTAILEKPKNREEPPALSKADRLAISMGGKRFDPDEPFPTVDISDEELEDFLQWREDMRNVDLEVERNWPD